MTEEIIIDGVDVSEWTDEEVRYKFEKHSSKAIRQIAFDLYKQLKHYKQALNEIENVADDYNRVEKTSQYYRDGFDEIQDIINKAKEK